MAATATVQFRLEPEKKKAAEELFNGMGLTLTTAFALFIQQSLNCNGLPFPVLGKQKAENSFCGAFHLVQVLSTMISTESV